ncbi:TetR/AcrR family transcriptional regulator [Aquidulcibacter sp.]|jgi:AcrR family transcriptional regulator|uniref:TetR/AcrR family transcriptional regulator n=1 Tax=Aquidulcibacter sp. TaxID=2052990 RepID=UPI003BA5BD1F
MPKSDSDQPYHHGSLKEAALAAVVARLRKGEEELPTVRELAAEIGVSHRALYRYFADKDALKQAVAAEGFALLAGRIPVGADLTALSVIDGFLRFAFDEPSLYRLMFSLRSTALLAEPVPGPQVRRVIALATQAFDDGAGEEAVRNRVFSAWGLAHGLFDLWRAGALRAASPDLAYDFIRARILESGLVD